MTPSQPSTTIRSVGVLGGGTAGYFAALAIKRRFPSVEVTVIESPNIPIIGVGEATTTLMPPFLFGQLGIDPVELHERVRPTFKLGIRFDWGPAETPGFSYPFGPSEPLAAQVHDGSLHTQSLNALLIEGERSPLSRSADGEVRSLLPELKFAYHLHNERFVAFLADRARSVGIHHLEAEVEDTRLDAHRRWIDALSTRDQRELRFDLYVDASGFRSVLVGKALGSPFRSFGTSLLCDSAIVGTIPSTGVVSPYTFAETMDAGWCWKIPVEEADHRGYVYSSAFLTEAQAEAEFRAKNPGVRDVWSLRFRSGRREDFWVGNAVAIGNAYGFVEPLESTALHMVIVEIEWMLAAMGQSEPADRRAMNDAVGAHWDYLRWFLAAHYKWNRRLATPFWRACEHDVDVSGLWPAIEAFRRAGFGGAVPPGLLVDDPAFGTNGLMTLLLGLDAASYPLRTNVPEEAWRARVGRQRAFVANSLPQREALELLRARPDLLRAIVEAPTSWCIHGHEFVSVRADGTLAHMPHGVPSR